jgi:hypothetical protein
METFGPIGHNSSNSTNSEQSLVSILLALSPLILGICGAILIVLYYTAILPSYEATLQKYYDYIEHKNSPIKNGKLNSNYIKLLYENNRNNIKYILKDIINVDYKNNLYNAYQHVSTKTDPAQTDPAQTALINPSNKIKEFVENDIHNYKIFF